MVASGSGPDLGERIEGEVSRKEQNEPKKAVNEVKLGRTKDKDGGDNGSENKAAARIAGI